MEKLRVASFRFCSATKSEKWSLKNGIEKKLAIEHRSWQALLRLRAVAEAQCRVSTLKRRLGAKRGSSAKQGAESVIENAENKGNIEKRENKEAESRRRRRYRQHTRVIQTARTLTAKQTNSAMDRERQTTNQPASRPARAGDHNGPDHVQCLNNQICHSSKAPLKFFPHMERIPSEFASKQTNIHTYIQMPTKCRFLPILCCCTPALLSC